LKVAIVCLCLKLLLCPTLFAKEEVPSSPTSQLQVTVVSLWIEVLFHASLFAGGR
ncbi:hypothetical protein Ancab_004639, partial [Ancistrocladus abbreviatus]